MSINSRLAWHFGGLIAATAGSVWLAGWPAALIVGGLWSMAATMFDEAIERSRP